MVGRFQHHGAAGRQGGTDLVHHEIQGKVERRDRGDDSSSHRNGEGDSVGSCRGGVERHELTGQSLCLLRRDLSGQHCPGHLPAGRRDGLTKLGGDQLGELLGPIGDETTDGGENLGTAMDRQADLHRRRRGIHRVARIINAGDRDRTQRLLRPLVGDRSMLGGVPPYSVDVEVLMGHASSLFFGSDTVTLRFAMTEATKSAVPAVPPRSRVRTP